MHPREEMIALTRRKEALRARIAGRRAVSVIATRRVLQPVERIDQGYRLWLKLPVVARAVAIPAALGVAQAVLPRLRTVGRILRWVPIAATAWRALRSRLGAAGPASDRH